MRQTIAIATALALLALLPTRVARAEPTAVLAEHLERVLAEASPELAACGSQVGLAAPAPAVAIRLLIASGKIKVELQGLEQVAKAQRKPLEKCLRAAVARHTVAKADIAFRPLALETTAPPAPPYDPVAARACTTSADCTIICENPSNCCAGQCGCSHAVNRSQVAAIQAARRIACAKPHPCPAVACALQSYRATCESGTCKAVRGGGVMD